VFETWNNLEPGRIIGFIWKSSPLAISEKQARMNYPKLSKGDYSRWRYENRIERVVTGWKLQIHSRDLQSGADADLLEVYEI
jgi:hypothetical protein